jgi:hypothetical protein
MAEEAQAIEEIQSPQSSFWENFFCGAAAGGLADLVMHPVDTLRTRIQVQRADSSAYKGTVDAFRRTVQGEGWRALYKGLGIVMCGTIPAHALYFSGYELCKGVLQPDRTPDDKSAWVHFVSGVGADVCGSMIWVPMDVVKQRLQVRRGAGQATGSAAELVAIWRGEGWRGLYRGYGAAIGTYGPFVGVYFTVYERCKLWQARWLERPAHSLPFVSQLVNGAVAGAVSAAVTCPMDVVKTRLQVQGDKALADARYDTALNTARTILREEGWRAFTKGIPARVAWITPGTAITIATYEEFKKLFQFLKLV